MPFREALVRYGQERKRENPQGYEDNVRYRLQLLLDHFDGLNIGDITLAKLQDFTDQRSEAVKRGTVLKELATVKAILNKAHREEHLAQMPQFPKLKPMRGRCRWLTLEEEGRLLKAANPRLRKLIRFAIDTGGRRSELLKLDWPKVNLARGFVTFTKTKNGEDRTVRLTARAKQVLMDLEPKESGPVFTYCGKAIRDVKTSFNAAREKAGLQDFRFHDLRHTFASRLVQQGVPLYEVMHLTGHKSFSMVQRYAHLAPEFQERAIKALEGYGDKTGGHTLGTVAENVPANDLSQTAENPSVSARVSMVGATGIEPVTPAV